jgi:hopene-associated glycosyltransferase HpnB
MPVPVVLAAIALAAWLYLLLFHGGFWRERPPPAPAPPPLCPAIVAIIPARNEVEVIGSAVSSLLNQRYPGRFSLILVDDHSTDGTAERARAAARDEDAEDRVAIVAARPLPAGWTGKLWAVAEGIRALDESGRLAEYLLLTDADILHHRTNLAELVAQAETARLDLASLMVRLRCRSPAERLLIPAFVFFFAMLYPFAWTADPRARTAGAAGGCSLVRRSALSRIGGIASIRGALIDDCALAAKIKQGGRIWLGLSARTRSLRPYKRLGDIWHMIARTAYTQLRYSPLILAGTVLGMALIFLAPPALVLDGGPAALLGGTAWLIMAIAYAPMLRFYRQPLLLAPLLPAIALVYTAATIDSALRHWRGRGGEWKGRIERREPA